MKTECRVCALARRGEAERTGALARWLGPRRRRTWVAIALGTLWLIGAAAAGAMLGALLTCFD